NTYETGATVLFDAITGARPPRVAANLIAQVGEIGSAQIRRAGAQETADSGAFTCHLPHRSCTELTALAGPSKRVHLQEEPSAPRPSYRQPGRKQGPKLFRHDEPPAQGSRSASGPRLHRPAELTLVVVIVGVVEACHRGSVEAREEHEGDHRGIS